MEKLLIYIVAFNHEKFIEKVLERIDKKIFDKFDTEILVNDDSSEDNTLRILKNYEQKISSEKCRFKILSNPQNLGYGGNQKIGYHYAIKYNFDYVALLHGDGQYAPELLEELIDEMKTKKATAVFGSRMINKGGALKGGMPLYKFIGNKILTFIQNKVLSSNLSEFHSGYRIYSVQSLKKIPFNMNSNDYSFDTEIIIQLLLSKKKIVEYPIPTYYGEEISYVNGLYYAYQILIETFKAKVQKYNIFYDKKYDLENGEFNYQIKEKFESPHSKAIELINNNSNILDLGCNDGSLGNILKEKKNCKVVGVDNFIDKPKYVLDQFIKCDLDKELPEVDYSKFDYIIMLDVIEHLKYPEEFLDKLYKKISINEKVEILISTANISFFPMRIMHLFGSFNYGKRGILDKTHTRLFTFSSFENLILGSNFFIKSKSGIPAPYPLAFGNNILSNFMLKINNFFILIFKSLFSYQIFMKIKPNPSLENLLKKSLDKSASFKN